MQAVDPNSLIRRELDLAAIKRCDYITVDSRGTAKNECGDLLPAVETGVASWESLTTNTTVFYPASAEALPLEAGSTYVWQVVREIRTSPLGERFFPGNTNGSSSSCPILCRRCGT